MPVGAYRVFDGSGTPVGREEFRCAPGPAGWRYFSTIETSVPEPHTEIVDLVVDGDWRAVRLRIDTGSHGVLIARRGDRLEGTRDGADLDIPPVEDLDYLSPCFNVATANRLGRSAEIDVAYFAPVTCELVPVRQRYERLGAEEVTTPVGRFAATAWRYSRVGSNRSWRLWVAGEMVVAYEGAFELAEYEPGPRGPFPL